MWLLECDGSALNGLRIWLKPDTRCVLGRTKKGSPPAAGEVRVFLENQASISRSHLTVVVDPVKSGDGARLDARSKLHFIDNNSKKGSVINGENLREGASKTISEGDQVVFHLGKYEPAFRAKWHPIILSIKNNNSLLAQYCEKVETLDVKVTSAYHPKTSYVVVSKRNTALGLQALVNGKSIVTVAYLDAIVEAATPSKGEELSPLELDFDQNWPSPENYLPPPANEPVNRPSELHRPDPRRKNLFEGWVFIFFDLVQYESLAHVITDARGKLEHFALEPFKTRAEEVVEFVRKKSQGSKASLVRVPPKQDLEQENDLARSIENLMGFKMLRQHAFLDIILTCDTSALQQPLDNTQLSQTPAPEVPTSPSFTTLTAPRPISPPRPRSMARSRKPRTYVDPFSIDDEETLPPPSVLPPPQIEASLQPDVSRYETAPASMPVDLDMSSPIPSSIPETVFPEASMRPQEEERTNKRPATPIEDSNHSQDRTLDIRTIKRRKAEERDQHRRDEDTSMRLDMRQDQEPVTEPEPESEPPAKEQPKSRGRKKVAEAEGKYIVKAREIRDRNARAEQKAQEEETAAMQNLNVEEMKNLAIIETMEVKPRSDKPVRDAYGDESVRWDESWNGRKNFKRFRRNGRGGATKTVGGTVMINLVEHKGADYGIGDGYWLDDDQGGSIRKSATRQVSQGRDSPYVTARESQSRAIRRGEPAPEPQEPPSPPLGHGTKRSATTQSSRAGGSKQRKLQLRAESESEEDSEDDLKFRFRRR